MFSLTSQQTKINAFTPRMEKHGDENVLAGTLKCETTCHSSVLDNFDKSLRKLPQLLPLKWDEDFPGYKIAIQSGLALDEVIKLDDVEIHGFAFEALDGGSVTVRWSANFNQDGRTSGKLCQLIQETVELSLMPPERDAEEVAA
jgi:hypothetical protein